MNQRAIKALVPLTLFGLVACSPSAADRANRGLVVNLWFLTPVAVAAMLLAWAWWTERRRPDCECPCCVHERRRRERAEAERDTAQRAYRHGVSHVIGEER